MTPEEHETKLKRIEELMGLDPELGSPDGQELDRLANEVIAYENIHHPIPAPQPTCAKCGEVVRVLGVESNGWVNLEQHRCPDKATGDT